MKLVSQSLVGRAVGPSSGSSWLYYTLLIHAWNYYQTVNAVSSSGVVTEIFLPISCIGYFLYQCKLALLSVQLYLALLNSVATLPQSRYDNNHNNHLRGVMNIKQYKKECTLTYYHAKIPNTSTVFGEDMLAAQKNTLK